jgi:hypothetical protein
MTSCKVKTMKMRMIKITPESLVEKLQGKISPSASNLPNDIELLDIRYDIFNKQVIAIVRSDSFEDTKETYPIPEFKITELPTDRTSVMAQSPRKQDAEKKPIPKVQMTQPIKTTAQSRPGTSLMEEEFNIEQRKMLNFSTDGDYVIVKPIKFLKAEWDDINEVVRSLGGRWVKGDIISYWEIPVPQK